MSLIKENKQLKYSFCGTCTINSVYRICVYFTLRIVRCVWTKWVLERGKTTTNKVGRSTGSVHWIFSKNCVEIKNAEGRLKSPLGEQRLRFYMYLSSPKIHGGKNGGESGRTTSSKDRPEGHIGEVG